MPGRLPRSVFKNLSYTLLLSAIAAGLAGCSADDFAGKVQLMPHGYCLNWDPQLLGLFVTGNLLVAISYYSIPAALWVFIQKRKDLAFNWMFRLFAAFIFWCGTTHVMKLWTIWHANYWAEASTDLITGLLSGVTAVLLWRLIPQALAIRSPKQAEEQNAEMRASLEKVTKAEKALRQNQERTQAIIARAADPFVAMSADGKIIDWNAASENTFGYSREEALGKTLSELIFPVLIEQEKEKGLQLYMQGGDAAANSTTNSANAQRIELPALRRDGREFPVELSMFPVETADGEIFCAFVRDIAEAKAAEDAIKEARDQALAASKFKSEFLANMSHEIRTPMNGILGMSEILMDSPMEDRERAYAATIYDAGQSLLTVINDILDFSKIEAGKLVLETSDFEPVRLVEGVAELFASQARTKELTLLTFIDPKLPKIMQGDAGRLRQVLVNLVGNAIKFSDEGEIVIRATLEGQHDGNHLLKFEVSDQGMGMSAEAVDLLFRPFVQIDGSMTRKQGGSGLGLSICKSLVEMMSGHIGVDSVLKKGSTFWFTVSLRRSERSEDVALIKKHLSGVRVLVVDDEDSAAEILQDYLLSWGMRTGRAKNGADAMQILERAAADGDTYSVVLIDLVLPKKDGMQLGRDIRASKVLSELKLVLVTAYDKPGVGQEAVEVAFDAYLTKPVKQSLLLESITNVAAKIESVQASIKKAPNRSVLQTKAPSRPELILVVEDHRINQEVALMQLRNLGFETHVAANGEEALELLEKAPYDLVLMDCQMPVMDGFDATRAIRRLETMTGKHLTVVAMTAHALEGSRDECLAAGMDDYLSKPVDAKRLKQMLDRWLPDQN